MLSTKYKSINYKHNNIMKYIIIHGKMQTIAVHTQLHMYPWYGVTI